MDEAYAQNTKDISEYVSHVNAGQLPIHRGYALTEWQRITREVIECIMCNNSINWRDMATRLQCSVETIKQAIHYDEQQLTTLQDDGLIVFDDESLHVLPEACRLYAMLPLRLTP